MRSFIGALGIAAAMIGSASASEAVGNPCKNPSDWNPDAPWGGSAADMGKCGQMQTANPHFFPASADACGDEPDDDGQTGFQRVVMAASWCCGGGPASEVCGAVGNPCKNPSDWNPEAPWGSDGGKCGLMQGWAPSYFPAGPDDCGDGPDKDGNTGFQRVGMAAHFCCSGGPMSEVCGAPVNPCATTGAFKPSNTVFGDTPCTSWSIQLPRTADECDTPTSDDEGGFTKDVAMNIGFAACCDSGDITPTCQDRPPCFQKFLKCFFEYEAHADANSAEQALARNGVKEGLGDDGTGDCFEAILHQVGGAEGCCKPITSVIECLESAIGDDWWTCPGLGERPFETTPLEAMTVTKALQTGGYCTDKPWEMGKVAELAYLQEQLKAARDKQAEPGCDVACKKFYTEQITSLEASVSNASPDSTTTASPDSTTTTTTIAEESSALRFSHAWTAVVTAAGLVTAVL